MKANELRVGNIVEAEKMFDNEGWSMTYISCDTIYNIAGGSGVYYRPILLTEEWLLKFGFEKVVYDSDDTGYGVDYHLEIAGVCFINYSDDFSCGIYDSKESSINGMAVIPKWESVKYVHSFQNLYFALTGEEIQIKN